MSLFGGSRVPPTPTLPQGETVAAYSTYLEAQRAVDHLSDRQFPVQYVTIVGTDLRMVERVTGRLSYSRVALSGFLSGVWFGLFIGLLFMLTSAATGILFVSVLVGGGFGLLFGVVSHALTGGKRDFTSQSQIVATQYAVLCVPEKANEARNLLREVGGVRAAGVGAPSAPAAPSGAWPSDPAATRPAPPVPAQQPPAPGQPPATPQYGQYAPLPDGQPRFGQYATPGQAATGTEPAPPAPTPSAPAPSAPATPDQQSGADTAAVTGQDPAARPEPQYGQYAPQPPEQPGEGGQQR